MAGKGIIIREAHFPGRAQIEAYGNGGFRFADMSHRGSLMCLPTGIHGWEPANPQALTVADFDRLLAEADKVEILLVGMGRDLRPLPAALRAALKDAGIASDPMSTGAAVRTYNVLLAENRAVAAALIAVD
ncbi:Mth938-like domain-containing protein [Mesorhizobium sp. CO1-1-11]|uniref:Mth938-like domain-containing protein n=1 Tax=Mesorhizobium sp. CO1-1-11 TaxID=2876636 RepID=UPI001CCA583A|nr:Mth938-like domain-containing protein [Mesorhizobium sp. CO1-1-11]MBZ9726268.1 Mth938-like domain-containing protein [Mesorhizobium sp. CO1-1-11]